MRELEIPTETGGDTRATEMLRVWLAHGNVQVRSLSGLWLRSEDSDVDESEAWGHILAEIAQHLAAEIDRLGGQQRDEAIARIRDVLLKNIQG